MVAPPLGRLHQHCDAVRLLGARYSCGIETIGYDDVTRNTWGRPLRTTELLQEVRSCLLAMQNLHAALSHPDPLVRGVVHRP